MRFSLISIECSLILLIQVFKLLFSLGKHLLPILNSVGLPNSKLVVNTHVGLCTATIVLGLESISLLGGDNVGSVHGHVPKLQNIIPVIRSQVEVEPIISPGSNFDVAFFIFILIIVRYYFSFVTMDLHMKGRNPKNPACVVHNCQSLAGGVQSIKRTRSKFSCIVHTQVWLPNSTWWYFDCLQSLVLCWVPG